MKKSKNIKVAVAQLAPVFLDTKATLEKAGDAIKEAGENDARLIVFPEVFLPGYPYWAIVLPPSEINDFNKKLFDEAVEIGGEDTGILCNVAREAGCGVVMGMHEKEGGTLYNTLLFISEKGEIIGKHRKLVPTSHERMIWGGGDGRDLKVFDSSIGKIGGLICFEHANCLFKYALQGSNEQIHIAVWPGGLSGISHKIDAAIRSYAFEGSCFVLNATSVLTEEVQDAIDNDKIRKLGVGGGYSAIVSPKGEFLAGPEKEKETILYADLDFDLITYAKMIVDTAGHYARPDAVQIKINKEGNDSIS
jgi:nitrilase